MIEERMTTLSVVMVYEILNRCEGNFDQSPGMDAFVIIGNANTRKSSVARSLTGCFNRSLRDIEPASGGPARKVYVRAGALQHARTRPSDFVAEALARRCDTVLVCLTPDPNPIDADDLPGAGAYLAQFRVAGWNVRSIAVLGQNDGGVRSPVLQHFPQAPTCPINVTAHAVRQHFGWR